MFVDEGGFPKLIIVTNIKKFAAVSILSGYTCNPRMIFRLFSPSETQQFVEIYLKLQAKPVECVYILFTE